MAGLEGVTPGDNQLNSLIQGLDADSIDTIDLENLSKKDREYILSVLEMSKIDPKLTQGLHSEGLDQTV